MAVLSLALAIGAGACGQSSVVPLAGDSSPGESHSPTGTETLEMETLETAAATGEETAAATGESPAAAIGEDGDGDPAAAPDAATVLVYFGDIGPDDRDCTAVAAYERTVDAAADPIRAAFDELVEGPTAGERDAGASSWFSAETAGSVRSTTLDADGVLVVDVDDLRQLISGASSSCGSESLLAALSSTAFQFPDVQRVWFEFEGSCEVFSEFLQRSCFGLDRQGNELYELPTSVPAGEALPSDGG